MKLNFISIAIAASDLLCEKKALIQVIKKNDSNKINSRFFKPVKISVLFKLKNETKSHRMITNDNNIPPAGNKKQKSTGKNQNNCCTKVIFMINL